MRYLVVKFGYSASCSTPTAGPVLWSIRANDPLSAAVPGAGRQPQGASTQRGTSRVHKPTWNVYSEDLGGIQVYRLDHALIRRRAVDADHWATPRSRLLLVYTPMSTYVGTPDGRRVQPPHFAMVFGLQLYP